MSSTYEAPILLINGLIGTLRDKRVIDAIGKRRVLAPDLYGYGRRKRARPCDVSILAQVALLREVVLRENRGARVHVVGHSVGGAIACFFAYLWPDLVASVTSIEGNFTLKDAFWSASVAKMSDGDVNKMLLRFRADPCAWLAKAGVGERPEHTATAARWLEFQPGSTVRRMAESVIKSTGSASYQAILRDVFASHAVHLIAGERSRAGWDVPRWALHHAASFTTMNRVGHLMMLEEPNAFGQLIATLTKKASTRRPSRKKHSARVVGTRRFVRRPSSLTNRVISSTSNPK